MSVADEILRLQQAKADIKSAIESKGVQVPSTAKYDAFDTYISQIQTGGSTIIVSPSDVTFIDYDGTVVYSYTVPDFMLLESMPENPTHTGLTAQGWNWTLADAKTYVSTYGKLVIGQMYVTTSGATEIDFSTTSANQSVTFAYAVDGTVSIDWGDGTTPTTDTGASPSTRLTSTHVYQSAGNHTISIKETTGTYRLQGVSGSGIDPILGNVSSSITSIRTGSGLPVISGGCLKECYGLETITMHDSILEIDDYSADACTSLVTVVLPSGMSLIGDNAFKDCSALKYVSMPLSITEIGGGAFINCSRLKTVMLSPNITGTNSNGVSTSTFEGCTSLELVIVPEGILKILSMAFKGCSSMKTIVIPTTVYTFQASSFANCTGMEQYIMKNTTPPTAYSSTFDNMPATTKIYVPSTAVNTYKAATTWSAYSNQIFANPL